MRSKVRQSILIGGILLFILSTLGITKSSAIEDNIWKLTIIATGQVNQYEYATNESEVRIGVNNYYDSNSLAPPLPPDYTVDLKILGDGEDLYEDIRQTGSDREEWILRLEIGPDADPNLPGYYPVLIWEPDSIGDGNLQLRRGDTEDGDLLVSDMSDANTYQSQVDDVSGKNPFTEREILTYTLVFLSVDPPEISSVPPSSAKAGDEYLYEPTLAADLADSWSLDTPPENMPPAGMSLDPNTGRITWTPGEDQVGDYEITLIAVNAGGSDSQTWTISAGPSIVSVPLDSAKAGEEYTYSPEVLGQGTATWSLIQKPEGMSVDKDSGHLTWVPQEEQIQTHTVILQVSVNGKEDSQSWMITVAAGSSGPPSGSSGGSGCFLSLF